MRNTIFLASFLLLLFSSLVLANPNDDSDSYHCNCVGCQASTHLKGSPDWCRCCENALVPNCRNPNTTDSRCQNSVFDPLGCINDGYLSEHCMDDITSDRGDINGTTSTSTSISTTTTSTTTTSTSTSTTTPSTTQSRPCPCVGCDRTWHQPGSKVWCNCCDVLWNKDCVWNYRCDRSVFDKTGCEANNFTQICQDVLDYPPHYDAIQADQSLSKPNQTISNKADDRVSRSGQGLAWALGATISVIVVLAIGSIVVFFLIQSERGRPSLDN